MCVFIFVFLERELVEDRREFGFGREFPCEIHYKENMVYTRESLNTWKELMSKPKEYFIQIKERFKKRSLIVKTHYSNRVKFLSSLDIRSYLESERGIETCRKINSDDFT